MQTTGSPSRHFRRLNPALLVAVCALPWTNLQPAVAAEGTLPGPAKAGGDANPAEATPSEPALFPGNLLSGFRKERQIWKDAGITFELQEQSEVWANLTGGGRQGLSYDGLTTGKLSVDLDKVVGWTGAEFHVEADDIHGHGPTRSHVGNLQIVSSLEATPSVKLYSVWLEQKLADWGSLRVGQEGANDELMTTAYGALYLNSSFGFPGIPAAVLPSGGPNYPLATPFARVQLKPSDQLTLIGAVYNGDPAPPGPGDPQIRDRNGTAFRIDDHALIIGELWYSPDAEASKNLPTTYKFGGWYASNHFADQRHDSMGMLLADPASSGLARDHIGDFALYGIVDQMVWRREGTKDQGIGLFLQVMGGPSDRNLSNLFIEGGMNWRAPFPDRTEDVAGLAFAYLGISPAAQRFSRDLVAFGRAASPYTGSETVLEATYSAPINDWLTLQPDAQLVINPNAGIPGNFGRAPLADAFVIGVRVTIKL
jgi:porin